MERIRMIGLGKSFGVRQVFSNVSFEIKEGDRIALVGPNGAGKSTLLKCILGIEELDEGQVIMSPVASIGYLQQDVNLGDASLAEEIETAWEDVHALELLSWSTIFLLCLRLPCFTFDESSLLFRFC